ncbi:MAG: DUF1800 family protein [Verrucomicrobia bacterium]|nr:DUF1800 family protein [Verrucomicrobiota bacterium]
MLTISAWAADPPPPAITDFHADVTGRRLQFPPYPAAEAYSILTATNLAGVYAADPAFALTPSTNHTTNGSVVVTNVTYAWRATNALAPAAFHRVEIMPMSSNALLAANVLNRLTYGPTPDELERVASIGPDAYIAEQLAPWSLTEDAEVADAGIPIIDSMLPAADEIVTSSAHAQLKDLRAWHVLRAVNARRQFLEILLQFLENHFVTEYGKSYVYFGRYYNNTANNLLRRQLATQLEYLENARWRQALLNPQCTFHDLLKISAESPAMIVYLDTVDSRGDGTRLANENYARELCELFCFGVDNGYDQQDIVEISKGWTGWRLEKVAPADAFNPFAAAVPGNKSTNVGVWAFNYKANFHNPNAKTLFAGKTVPARFGPPWAGASYQLVLTNGSGTNSIRDGHQIIAHMADQPFTQEYLCMKLCRLLVHDRFPNPSTRTNLPEYAFYDYTRPDLSPEAQLVHACMMAWETNSPKGQVWKVLETIVKSDLFRSHGGSMQKVKTPLEYAISAIRALRSSVDGSNRDGSFTADTDGYSISGSSANTDNSTTSPVIRMGTMMLFDREAPDGYPEDGPAWISAGTLAERIRFIQSYCIAQGQSGHTGGATVNDAVNCVCNPVALLQHKLPGASWTNAPAVAAYFTDLLYPAEGSGNLELYRKSAEDFLNTSDAGAAAPFASLSPSSTPGNVYDTRVRGMVSLLMTLPRFHEQ